MRVGGKAAEVGSAAASVSQTFPFPHPAVTFLTPVCSCRDDPLSLLLSSAELPEGIVPTRYLYPL